tara:strand:- start:688 stop:1182 length:495 start_codon:yes stop_codon:yes gene_type:complete
LGQVQRTTDHEAERVLLVVVDDSDEMPVALHFACRRAEHADGRVALFYVPAKADFQHWMAVGDLMREEAREVGEEILQRHSAEIQKKTGKIPILYIREGDRSEELIKLMDEEPNISTLVLAAGTDASGPGPIISYLIGKGARHVNVPITIVPGTMTVDEINAIT